ncbi:MAG: hypothetical protein HQK55_10610, partial [Deltaproteobacteria bacterium]|nr:hypothetical protein [Deltaproteobacteria bacterium]
MGGALLLYNFLRFQNPFELGIKMQLSAHGPANQGFSLGNIFYNINLYLFSFLGPDCEFPYFHIDRLWTFFNIGKPASYFYGPEDTIGILNSPAVILSFGGILLLFDKKCQAELKHIISIVTIFAMTNFCILLLIPATMRYLTDFLPGLLFIASIYILIFDSKPERRRATGIFVKTLVLITVIYSSILNIGLSITGYSDKDLLAKNNPELYAKLARATSYFVPFNCNEDSRINNININSLTQFKDEIIKRRNIEGRFPDTGGNWVNITLNSSGLGTYLHQTNILYRSNGLDYKILVSPAIDCRETMKYHPDLIDPKSQDNNSGW